MGEAPHEVYTDAELKARADKVCGNCKWWAQAHGPNGLCVNDNSHGQVDTSVWLPNERHKDDPTLYKHLHTHKDFGCIHFEPK